MALHSALTARRLAMVLAVSAWVISAQAGAASLTIGEINPLTGRLAAHGTALHRGILLAVDEANASGSRVSLVTRDDEGRPERAVAAAEELTARVRATALVGGYVDTLVGPISEVAERQRIPFVATASLDERLTARGYRYFFRISHLAAYVDSVVGVTLEAFKPARVAILSSATPGASQLGRRQRERLEQVGVRIPVVESLPIGMTDFTPFLVRVRESGADLLLANAFFADHLVMVRQLRALDVNVKAFLGAFGMEFPEVIRQLGPSGEFLFGTTGWEPGITAPGTEAASSAFVDRYRARFQAEPPPLAMHGYAATRAILAAADRAGASGQAADPEQIRQALLALDLMTPLERLQFDSRGESRHYRRLITQVQSGKRLVVYPPDRATGKARYPMPPWSSR